MIKITPVLLILTMLASCDALKMMPYRVQNKTGHLVRLQVKGYPLELSYFPKCIDTIIQLKPEEWITVGLATGVGSPYEIRTLYKDNPGINNFKIVSGDSLVSIDTDDKYWHYRDHSSKFRLK